MRFLIALLAVAGLVFSVLTLKVHIMDPSKAPPGNGTTGMAAARNKRSFLLIDSYPTAVEIMTSRLAAWL